MAIGFTGLRDAALQRHSDEKLLAENRYAGPSAEPSSGCRPVAPLHDQSQGGGAAQQERGDQTVPCARADAQLH